MRNSLLLAAAVGCLLAAIPALAAGPMDIQSRQALAAGAYADINCNGVALPTIYVGEVTGNTNTGAFQDSAEIGSFNKTWQLPGTQLGLSVSVTGLNTGVSGTPAIETPFTFGQLVASFSVASETVSLVSVGDSAAPPLFSVTMQNAYGNARMTTDFEYVQVGTEYQNAASVTVSGSLLGPRVIKAPLNPAQRTVIFSTPGYEGGADVVLNVVDQFNGGEPTLPNLQDVTAVRIAFGSIIPSLVGCSGIINMGYGGIYFPNY